MNFKTVIILSLLVLAALACTLTQPTGAKLAPLPTNAPNVVIQRETTEPTPTATPTSTKTQALTLYCVVESDALNIRQCAGIDCPVIAWAYRGDRLDLLPALPAGSWIRVESGWINSTYCEVIP